MLSAYYGASLEIAKVFSAHVNDFPTGFDPEFFRHRGGRVAILNWRRGRWEDVVMADLTALAMTRFVPDSVDESRTAVELGTW